MQNNRIVKLIDSFGLWRMIHIILAAIAFVLVCVFVLELMTPISADLCMSETGSNINVSGDSNSLEIIQTEESEPQELIRVIRPNLFKASKGLSDKPMADKTIERIKSSLKLQCIMEMNGRAVAYINIDGVGLKQCKAGDAVENLFTVLNINERSVEIAIVDHKVILEL